MYIDEYFLKVRLQGSPTSDVGGPAMESAAERICEPNRNFDAFDAQTFEHFLDSGFVGVDDNALGVQHQDIHRQPLGGHPQRMVVWHEWRRWLDHRPARLLKHGDLVARTIWIAEDETGTDDVERRVDVHGVRILEGKRVNVDAFGR